MLTGPAAQQATELLLLKIPEESGRAIIEMVVSDPHDANLVFIETLFKFTPEEISTIRTLRDSAAAAQAEAVASKAAAVQNSLVEEMRILWKGLYEAQDYPQNSVHTFLEHCIQAVGYNSSISVYPGLLSALGFGCKVARETRGLTQRAVTEQHGITASMLRSVEQGHRDPTESPNLMVYLESLFPSAKRCSEEPIKLLLGEELHRQKFFEHIQRHLIVALSRGERSQPHSADEG